MKKLVVYSSKTGNTKMVAEAIFDALEEPKSIYPVIEAPPPDSYDFIAMGFWVDKGTADENAREYMRTIQGKEIGIFGTLGAYPDSEHARQCLEKVRDMLDGNQVKGEFLCQGKINPAILEMMAKSGAHAMTPERWDRIEEAKKHPNQQDFSNARETFKKIMADLEKQRRS